MKIMEEDFLLTDRNGRNILHRASIEQNHEWISDILSQFIELEQNKYSQQAQRPV